MQMQAYSLALPLGELSPQVTERADNAPASSHAVPSPSSLRSATSPKGRGKLHSIPVYQITEYYTGTATVVHTAVAVICLVSTAFIFMQKLLVFSVNYI